MRHTLLLIILCIQTLTFAQAKFTSVGASYRVGNFDSELKARGFDFSFQKAYDEWFYLEASLLHLNGSNFDRNFEVRGLDEIEPNTTKFNDRAMINNLNLKLHLSFWNTQKNLMSIFYGLSYYHYNSSYYGRVVVGWDSAMLYQNTSETGFGTILGLSYMYKLNERIRVGLEFSFFNDRNEEGTSMVLVKHRSFGFLLQRNF